MLQSCLRKRHIPVIGGVVRSNDAKRAASYDYTYEQEHYRNKIGLLGMTHLCVLPPLHSTTTLPLVDLLEQHLSPLELRW